MDEDERLRQLIAVVCQYPDATPEWRRAMHRLLIVIQGLPEFSKYSLPGRPDYFLDALNRTWEWLSREIRNFKLQTSSIRADLVKWINGYLYWRIKDLRPSEASSPISLDTPIGNPAEGATFLDLQSETGISPPTLSDLDSYIRQLQKEEIQRTGLELELYIEQDPEGRLRRCHPRREPDCNCQLLSQRLCLKHPPDSLANIAWELNINYQTVAAHWRRKGLPLLQQIAIELGYQHNNQES
jgi:hypothetical protein